MASQKFKRFHAVARYYNFIPLINVNQKCSYVSSSTFAKVNRYRNQKLAWKCIINEAKQIVGYPPTFSNLQYLLKDDVANIALHLRKLIGSNHQLLKTLKGMLYDGKNDMQIWGLIVLLVSKAAGHISSIINEEYDKSAGILPSQRTLAEVTEMIRTTFLIHKTIINLDACNPDENLDDLVLGNKLALLCGDYLIGYSLTQIASLRNQELSKILTSITHDITEAEFLGPRDKQNNPLPARPIRDLPYKFDDKMWWGPLVIQDSLGNARAEWTLRHTLNIGSLLGKSCYATLKLAGHSKEFQEEHGYLFGKHLMLAWQACLDCEPFLPESSGPFSLVSAPLMFHLQHDPDLYSHIELGHEDVFNVDYDVLRKAVQKGPGLDLTRKLQVEHSQTALDILNKLPYSDARTALANIVAAIQDL